MVKEKVSVCRALFRAGFGEAMVFFYSTTSVPWGETIFCSRSITGAPKLVRYFVDQNRKSYKILGSCVSLAREGSNTYSTLWSSVFDTESFRLIFFFRSMVCFAERSGRLRSYLQGWCQSWAGKGSRFSHNFDLLQTSNSTVNLLYRHLYCQ